MNAFEFFLFRIVPAFTLPTMFFFIWLPQTSPDELGFCIFLTSLLSTRFLLRAKKVTLALDAGFLLAGALALLLGSLILADTVHRDLRRMPDSETYIPIAEIESGKRKVPEHGCLIIGGPVLCRFSKATWGPDRKPFIPISAITTHDKERWIIVRGWFGDDIPHADTVVDQLLIFAQEGKLRTRSRVNLRIDKAEAWAGLGALSFGIGLFLFVPNIRRQWREGNPRPLPETIPHDSR